MSIETVLNQLIERQLELVELDREVGQKLKKLEAQANAECNEINKRAMQQADIIRAPLQQKLEQYRAEVKAKFGITDGETMNVVQMLKAVHDMINKPSSGLILP